MVVLLVMAVASCGGGKKDGGSSSGGKENPATDFKYDLNKAGDGIVIGSYTGNNGGKVVVPAKIEGYPVVEIGWLYDSSRGLSFVFAEPTDKWIKDNPGKPFNTYEGSDRKTRITAVVIPDTVTLIGSGAFQNCTALKQITLPKSLKIIASSAFLDTGLTSITVPEGVTEIRDAAFSGCSSLASVTLPETLGRLGGSAFYRCTALTDIKLPSKPIKYGRWEDVNWDGGKFIEGLESFEETFNDCPKLSLSARKAIKDSGYKGEF